MTKTSPNNIDLQIGRNLKLKRIKTGKSLQELGNVLDVSFRRIQKYERGQNKISSSSLFILANSLEIDVRYFFNGLLEEKVNTLKHLEEEREIFEHIDSIPNHEVTNLVKFYSQIKDHTIRKKTLDLIRSLCKLSDTIESDL